MGVMTTTEDIENKKNKNPKPFFKAVKNLRFHLSVH